MMSLFKKDNELATFGLLMAAFITVIFGLVLPRFFDWINPIYALLVSAVFVTLSFVAPKLLAPVFKTWMAFGEVLSRVNTFIILLLVYLILFVPISILFRLVRYDPMRRSVRGDTTTNSYRIVRQMPLEKSSLENPF